MALARFVNLLLRGLALAGSCRDRQMSELIADLPSLVRLDEILASFPDTGSSSPFNNADSGVRARHRHI